MSDLSRLRILYVGDTGPNGRDKRRAMQALGVALESFDTSPFTRAAPRPWRMLAHRTVTGPAVRSLNRALLAALPGPGRVSHVWIDKGNWLWPDTLRALRERTGAALVHYANDSLLHDNRSRHFRAGVPLYDVHFTTKRFELEGLRALGARSVHLTYDAVEPSRFHPRRVDAAARARFGSDTTFIGRCEPHYVRSLRAASPAAGRLRIWGPRWPRHARWHRWARAHVEGAGVWFDDYPVALSAARICLGLLSKRFPETVTTRSFEIPACGSLLVAERSEDHQSLFAEDREAVFFASPEELGDKLRFYRENEAARARIAAAGRERFERSGYTRADRFRQMLEVVTAD